MDYIAYNRYAAEAGVGSGANERMALFVLHRDGGFALGALAQRIVLSRAAMTTLADRLTNVGLVERQADPGDRRRLTLVLTERGRAAVDAVLNIVAAEAALNAQEADVERIEEARAELIERAKEVLAA